MVVFVTWCRVYKQEQILPNISFSNQTVHTQKHLPTKPRQLSTWHHCYKFWFLAFCKNPWSTTPLHSVLFSESVKRKVNLWCQNLNQICLPNLCPLSNPVTYLYHCLIQVCFWVCYSWLLLWALNGCLDVCVLTSFLQFLSSFHPACHTLLWVKMPLLR